MADLDNIISPNNPEDLGNMGKDKVEPSAPLSTQPMGVDLPSDLKIPVAKAPISTPQAMGDGIDDLLLKQPDTSKKSVLLKQLKLPWGWIAGGILVVLLIIATVYFFGSKISFNTGTINLTFEPVGVDVVIDGKFKKQSVNALTVKLKTGVHIIEVIKDGYLDIEKEIDVVAKEKTELNIVLQTIPSLEVLVEKPTRFVDLIQSSRAVAYCDVNGNFEVVDLEDGSVSAAVFQGSFDNIQSVAWSPGDPAAMVKIENTFKLINMYDNRNVVGRFIPFGKSPEQGLPFNNGIATWLFSDILRNKDGWRPILLNESIREVDFAPDGSRIIYFYETADGERSIIVAHPNGDEWERLISQVDADNPNLKWLNDDRYVLVFDDGETGDKLFDTINQELTEIMPDRVKRTMVESSPDGTRLLYVADDGGSRKLAIWNIASKAREFIFDSSAKAFTWKNEGTVILAKEDNSLWYWNLTGKIKPVKFVSAVGELVPQKLLYSLLSEKLLIITEDKIVQLTIN